MLTKRYVLAAIPPVLRRAALNPQYTEEACDLLWQLGRNDPRDLNPYPDHALRALADLAAYQPSKPLIYSEKVLRAAEKWLKDPHLPDYKFSPLDVVSCLLVKQAEHSELKGHTISFGFVRINLSVVATLRKEAIAFVEECLRHPSPRVSIRALDTVREVISHPASLGRVVSEEERSEWKPEQLEGIRLLRGFLLRTTNPVLQAAAICEFSWLAKNGQPPDVAEGVSEALAQIPQSLDLDLAIALTGGLYTIGTGAEDFVKQQEDFIADVADRFLKGEPESSVIASKLEQLVGQITEAKLRFSGSQLPWTIATKSKEKGQRLLEHILEHKECLLVQYAPAFLVALRREETARATAIAGRMVASGREDLQRALASSYFSTLKQPTDEDFVILGQLLSHDENCKYHVLQALTRLKEAEPPERRDEFQKLGIQLILAADIGQSSTLAEALCQAIDQNFGIPPDLLDNEEIDKLLRKLVPVQEITLQSFHLGRFLSYIVARSPLRIVRFFKERISYEINRKKDGSSNYSPTPFGMEGLFGPIANTDEHVSALREIAMTLNEVDAVKRYWFTKLFVLISGSFGASTIRVIADLAEDRSENAYKIIANLLREAPREFPFSEKDLCVMLLERAHDISDDIFRTISGALLTSTQTGSFNAVPGQPSPQYLFVKTSATQLASEYDKRPIVSAFYRQVAETAQASIEFQLTRDEETFVE